MTKLKSLYRALRRRWRPVAAMCLTAVVAGALWLRLGPIDPVLLNLDDATSTVVVDRRGVPLYESLSGDGTRSVHLDAANLPPVLVAATIAAEDRRFWSHPGVDVIAIARALRRNISEGSVVEGGSTISQQVAKLLLNRQAPKRSRGVREKIREAMLALRLEHRFSKRELLALYLNLAAYGNQIVGAGRASRAYFGTDPSMLTPAQAAFLAGLPQRPSGYNPFRHREQALARQRAVLKRMQIAGVLTAARAEEARDERLQFSRTTTPFLAPHFVEMVIADAGPNPPARIETTIDAGLQSDIAGIIRSYRAGAGSSRRVKRRRRRARQRARGMAGLGRLGQLRRRRARRGDQRATNTKAARIGAQAIHVCARVRIGIHAGQRARRRAGALSNSRSRRPL